MKTLLFSILLFLFLAPFYAHEQLSVTRVEFEARQKRHYYAPLEVIHFQSILLQSKFLVSGAHLPTFSPETGLKWLKGESPISVFVSKNGFDWGSFQYPRDFTISYTQRIPHYEEEYSGVAISKEKTAPWFDKEFYLLLEIRDEQNRSVKILHQGKLEKARCYVEYRGAGLKKESLESQDNERHTSLSFLRAVVALEDFSVNAPETPGRYQLYAEFRTQEQVLLEKGSRFFEVSTEPAEELNLFVGLKASTSIKKGNPGVVRLELRDGKGKLITSPAEGYIREASVSFMKDTGSPNMTDAVIRDYHWMPMPPNFKAQFPFEIPINEQWMNFFKPGTVYYSFTIVREFYEEEVLRVSGSFVIES